MGVKLVGVGSVSCYGWGNNKLWDGAMSGMSSVRKFPSNRDLIDPYIGIIDDPDPDSRESLYTRILKHIVNEVIEDAESKGWKKNNRVALIHSSVSGDVRRTSELYRGEWSDTEFRRKYAQYMPSTIANRIARTHNFNGPFLQIDSMCASGSAAILHAKMLIDADIVDSAMILNGEVGMIYPHMKGFLSLGVASMGIEPDVWSRPFQEDTKGLIGAEGAAGLLLTRDSDDYYYDIRGGAMTNDAFSLTRIDPSYTQLKRCVEEGLENAGVRREEVSTYNSHGPGTRPCNEAEKFLITKYFSEAQVYSFKPLVGHCMSAAAGMELVLEAMAQRRAMIPAPRVHGVPIIDNLIDGPTPRKSGIGAKISIGLGGTNTLLLLDAA